MTQPALSEKPLVVSVCGTFLKPEMLSVYRQVTELRRWRTRVFCEERVLEAKFPFADLVVMKKNKFRPRGNFLRRFFLKHIVKKWPPPGEETKYTPPPGWHTHNLGPLLKEHQPQVLHIYYGHKAAKFLPMVEAWNGPLVVSFHGVDATATAYKGLYAEALPALFARSTLVLARSQSLADRIQDLGCPPQKIRLNRTPIPLQDIPRRIRTAPEHGEWVFIQACRLIPKKGLLTALAAFSEFVRHWPRAHFVIAGDGPQRGVLQSKIAELSLHQHVTLAGWVTPLELMRRFDSAHVFVHPSEITSSGDQEGVPNAMLEAMAAGLPVVATTHGGIPEAVTDGSEGLLVPERSPARLTEAFLRLAGDREMFARFSAAASAKVESTYGLPRSIAALEDCYDEAAALYVA